MPEHNKKDTSLILAHAIEFLDASRDPYDSSRWRYFAEETSSNWSVSQASLLKLGDALGDASGREAEKAAYEAWAEADEEAYETKGRR